MIMTRDKIEELKRLAKAATPGEWAHDNNTVATRQACITVEAFGASYDETVDNAAFIAAANPQTILSLLALAERALEPQGQALPPDGQEK